MEGWSKHLAPRLAGPFCVACLSYMALWINTYCVSEWTQNHIKESMFGNESLQKSASCANATSPDYVKLQHVQQETARWSMYNTMTVKSVSLVITFLLTVYTDIFGRRFLLILCCMSILLNHSLNALIIYFDMEIFYTVIGSAIYGLTGTSYGLLAGTYAYVADITSEGQQRSLCLFLADVSISLGGTTGAYIAGEFIQAYGFAYPALTSAGISFVTLLIAVVSIRESLPKERRPTKTNRPQLISSIKTPFKFYVSKEFYGKRRLYVSLLLAFVFSDMTGVHRKTIETLYQLGMPFCWSPSKIGFFATINSLAANTFGLVGIKAFQRCMNDATIAVLSMLTTAGAFTLEALARTDVLLYLVAAPACLSNLPTPIIRSVMSTMSPVDKQGALSASLLVVQTLTSFVTGILDNSVYAATLPIFNGFVFLVFAFYCLMSAFFLGLFYLLRRKASQKIDQEQDTSTNC